MKRLFLYILLSLVSMVVAYATVVVYSEFRIVVEKDYMGAVDPENLRYDQTRCLFEIVPGPDNIEIDYDRVPLYNFVQPSDTMKWDTFTGYTLLSVPEWQLKVKCGFEFIRFEDTGGQVESVDCYFNISSVVSFKKNYTGHDIRGILTVHYNALRSDASSPLARSMTLRYLQKAQPPLNAGSLPEFVYVNDEVKEVLIPSSEDASGGSEAVGIQYSWEQWQNGQWVAIEGTGQTLTVANPIHHSAYRRKAVSDGLTAYTNFCRISYRQLSNENYILKKMFLTSGTDEIPADYTEDVTYYDGLGRPVQQIGIAATYQGKDFITPVVYDKMGRGDTKNYLPYAGASVSGSFRSSALNEQQAFYTSRYGEEGTYAYSQRTYETSPLGRLISECQPGKIYRSGNHKIDYEYGVNNGESIFQLQLQQNGDVRVTGIYSDGVLQKTWFRNEDGQQVVTYTNSIGRKILEKVELGEENRADTYYIYDDEGRLRWVITPEGASRLYSGMSITLAGEFAGNYCFCYVYDAYGNMVSKMIPGRAPENYIYDGMGRIVLRQDGQLRIAGKWVCAKYDVLGRTVEERLLVLPSQLQGMTYLDKSNLSLLYAAGGILLAAYEYDNYRGNDLPFIHPFGGFLEESKSTRVKGFKTSETLAVLKGLQDSEPQYIKRKFYYNQKGRLIQIVENNHFGNTDTYSYQYDWMGRILAEKETHMVSRALTTEIIRRNMYDSRGRLLHQSIEVGGLKRAGVGYYYDELGRRSAMSMDQGKSFMMYNYDLQDKLISLISPSFSMNLRYEFPEKAAPSYTGKITEWEWKWGSATQMYALSYDKGGRLSDSRHFEDGTETNRFAERSLTYDRNGNLLTLQRTAAGTVTDELTYNYQGNLLTSLTDQSGSAAYAVTGNYEYDKNGNMIKDAGRRLDFEYNILNLLYRANETTYSYAYDGSKLSVRDSKDLGYDYLGSCIYSYRFGYYQLQSISFGEGLIMEDLSAHYFLKDHLGSIRAVVNGATGTLEEANDYYPFGACHVRSDYVRFASNRFKYNGKEEQPLIGSNYLDYGARMYDASVGRWLTVDPLAEKYYSLGSYVYCANNPVMFIDPNGMFMDEWRVDINGNITYFENDRPDRLYAVDEYGNETASMAVKDRRILDQLTNSSKISKRGGKDYELSVAIGNEDSQTEMLRTFLFMSDHTNVEWRIDRYTDKDKTMYSLGTKHDTDFSPSPQDMGHSLSSTVAFIHSHPDIGTSFQEEIESMGWFSYMSSGDSYYKSILYKNTYYYTYFPNSRRLWHVEDNLIPSLIRSHITSYKDFLFGTINTR